MPPERPRSDTFADRAKREAERFRLATDTEFWIAFCFRSDAAADAFTRSAGGDPAQRRIPGSALPQAPARADPRPRALRLLAARSTRGVNVRALLSAAPAPDPLQETPETGDLEHDSATELRALHTALTAAPDPRPASVLDSPYWTAAWWPHRDAKEAWLAATGCDLLGDKYLDGHEAARILGIYL